MSDRGKLGSFLKEVIDWRWDEFCKAELEPNYTGYQAAVFALVRTTSEGKLSAIKLAIDRVDGKVETPVQFIYPKIWLLFPEAKAIAPQPALGPSQLALPDPLPEMPKAEPEEPTESAATLTLRQTLEKMADSPRVVTQLILQRKLEVEAQFAAGAKIVDDEDVAKKIPMVKSVIAANLLNLAEKNNFEAISEIFDQLDGKLVETIRILGDDIHLVQYALEAPFGAVKNKDGIYMLEAKELTEQWKDKLKND